MFNPQAHIDDVVERIADGAPVDWTGISADSDAFERRVLENLKVVAQIASLHASPSLLDSLTSGSLGPLDDGRHAAPLPAGSKWGHLKILECVGRGRFGVVYRAFDTTLERDVALKILHNPQRSGSEIAYEGRMMARVHHPNVVTVFGAQVIEDEVGIWMQFVGGPTLEAELRTDGPFSADEIIQVGVDLCQALAAVHAVGLVHRDVKAANVMRDVTGRIVLGDFGTGQLIEYARAGIAGTPLYLAPELIAGGPATPQSDIYSLGVLLFHLATGAYPVNGRSIRDLSDAHNSGNHLSLGALRPDLPSNLVEVIDRAITANTANRWNTAVNFQMRLGTPQAFVSTPARTFPFGLNTLSRKTAAFFVTAAAGTIMLVGSATTSLPTNAPPSSLGTPKITTRSTRALRLYTVAASMMEGRAPWPEAEAQRLLREALDYDPEFASARILLAHSLNNQNRPLDEVMTEAARARESAGTSSEEERAFIEGSFYDFRGKAETDVVKRRRDLEHAASTYEYLLRLAPNHAWGYTNLVTVYTVLHRDADVLRIRVLDARNHPDSGMRQGYAAMEYYRIGDFNGADPFIKRGLDLMRHQADTDVPFAAIWLLFAPAHRSWSADSALDALRVVDAVTLPASDDRIAMVFVRQKVALYLALGRLNAAERASSAAPTTAERDDLLLSVLAYRNDRERMRELLSSRYTTSADVSRVLLLPVPEDILATHLRKFLADQPGRWRPIGTDMFILGRLALADGRFDEAIAMLQKFEPFRVERGRTYRMLMALTLSDAWTSKGETSRAIAELESATELRSAATFGASTGALWIQTRAKLAELYRQTGQVAEAERIEQHLRKLLVVADDDHPVKRQLDKTIRGSLQNTQSLRPRP